MASLNRRKTVKPVSMFAWAHDYCFKTDSRNYEPLIMFKHFCHTPIVMSVSVFHQLSVQKVRRDPVQSLQPELFINKVLTSGVLLDLVKCSSLELQVCAASILS